MRVTFGAVCQEFVARLGVRLCNLRFVRSCVLSFFVAVLFFAVVSDHLMQVSKM